MIPFFLKKRQADLQSYADEVAKKKVKTNCAGAFGTKTALEEANQAYMVYLLATRNRVGKILSIIPGTSAFQSRLICAEKISNAFICLRKTEKRVDESATHIKKVIPKTNMLTRSKSNDATPVKHYDQLFSIKRTRSKSLEAQIVRQVNGLRLF